MMTLDYDTVYKVATIVSIGWLVAKIIFGLEVEIKVLKANHVGSQDLVFSRLEGIVKTLDEVKNEIRELRK